MKAVLVCVGLAVSAILAFGGYEFWANYGIVTPGILIARALVPARSYPQQIGSFAEDLRIQILVDFVFWFLVMWAASVLFGKLWHRSAKAGSAGSTNE